ncbi:hypothetical protein [Primorskyibacter sp. S187A]|uniref:hypothetical protein n=1 Tax=Primorskyibacter sp. S187A TaxID=3415130 RepID=UPI003C7E8CC5
MIRPMTMALCAGLMISIFPGDLHAGPISRACLKADRPAANARLCRCIQAAADRDLSRADQRLAAGFFRDPHRAQEIRQSDRPSHERFWERYKRFGARAQAMCG